MQIIMSKTSIPDFGARFRYGYLPRLIARAHTRVHIIISRRCFELCRFAKFLPYIVLIFTSEKFLEKILKKCKKMLYKKFRL